MWRLAPTCGGHCRQPLNGRGVDRAHGANVAPVLARQQRARPGVGCRLSVICGLQLDGRGYRLYGLVVQRRARAQRAGRMYGTERGADPFVEPRATHSLYAKVDGTTSIPACNKATAVCDPM